MIVVENLNVYLNNEEILMKLSELATSIESIATQLAKAQEEILQRIAELEASLDDLDLPANAVAALDALRAQSQTLDDIVPDEVV